jgi:hypothetical protein
MEKKKKRKEKESKMDPFLHPGFSSHCVMVLTHAPACDSILQRRSSLEAEKQELTNLGHSASKTVM